MAAAAPTSAPSGPGPVAAPTALTTADWSTLLTVVDFVLEPPLIIRSISTTEDKKEDKKEGKKEEKKEEEKDASSVPLWDMRTANIYERLFWREAESDVRRKFTLINIALHTRDAPLPATATTSSSTSASTSTSTSATAATPSATSASSTSAAATTLTSASTSSASASSSSSSTSTSVDYSPPAPLPYQLYFSRVHGGAAPFGMPYYRALSSSSAASAAASSASSAAPAPAAAPDAATEPVPLTRREVSLLRDQLHHYFTGEPDGGGRPRAIFDYAATLTQILRGCSHVLAAHLPQFPTLKRELDRIKVVHTKASGEEWMVPYEISFEANMANYQVALPDPFKLTPAHTVELLKLFKLENKGKLYRDMWITLFDTGCHEILHCVQAVAGQTDGLPMSWSAEHDASYAAQTLLAQLARHPSVAELFPPGSGFLYQVLNNNLRWARRCYVLWSDAVRGEYMRWRDAFGLAGPSKLVNEQTAIVDEFKGILSTESTYLDPALLHVQLDVLFNSARTGDVHKAAPIVLPPALQREPGLPRRGLLRDD